MTAVVPAPPTRTVSHLHPPGSFEIFDHPLPSRRDEVWRFTPVDQLTDLFDPTRQRTALTTVVESGADPLATLAPGRSPRGTVLTPVDRSAAIAAAVPQAGHLVIGGIHSQPVRLAVTPASDLSVNHLVIESKPGSSATVLITHTGASRHIGNVEILVAEDADLTVVSIQDWQPGSVHIGQHEALVAPGAKYRHVAVSIGGDLVRLQNNVSFSGAGGEAELFGVYFATAGQHLEHRLFVDHNHPKSVSRVDYRGALQGEKAHSVWVGDVLIRPQATGIETYESNKNLVLTDGCRADAVPNLEIETGQIAGAGHSASTGRFDDEQLFYLQSRGILPGQARHLVVRGFFTTILSRIGIMDVEARILDRIDAALGDDKENWT